MPTESQSGEAQSKDDGQPYNVTKTLIECPFGDGELLAIEIGWVIPYAPVLHINAPAVIDHLHNYHPDRMKPR